MVFKKQNYRNPNLKWLTVIKPCDQMKFDDIQSIQHRMENARRNVGSDNRSLEEYFAMQLAMKNDDWNDSVSAKSTINNSIKQHLDDKKLEKAIKDFISEHSQSDSVIMFVNLMGFLKGALQFEYQIDHNTYKDDDIFKFDLYFTVIPQKFHRIVKNIFKIINHAKVEKFILQIPYQILYNVETNNNAVSQTPMNHMKCQCFSMGSLINLDRFFCRVSYSIKSDDPPMVFKHIAKDKFDNEVELLMFLPESHKMFRVSWKIAAIKRFVIHKFTNFDRIFFELNAIPLIHYCDSDAERFNQFVQDNFDIDWTRTLEMYYVTRGRKLHYDSNLIGCSRTIAIDFQHEDSARSPIFDLLLILFDRLYIEKGINIPIYSCKVDIIGETFSREDVIKLIEEQKLGFDLTYACYALFGHDFKCIDMMFNENFVEEFFSVIRDVKNSNDPIREKKLVELIFLLSAKISSELISSIKRTFYDLFMSLDDIILEELPPQYVSIRIIEVYPSHIRYLRPILTLHSRFSHMAEMDHTMRVKLLEDGGNDFGKIWGCDVNFSLEIVKKRYSEGFTIADRKYEFCGASSSQMKEYASTFYSKDSRGLVSSDIRQRAGEFGDSNSVSKYLSRVSLIFSQSLKMFELPPEVPLVQIQDIFGNEKPNCKNSKKKVYHCLTDGIGYYSSSVSDFLITELKSVEPTISYVPSAYQIRFGGHKGMLSHNPRASNGVYFRPSMKKYDSSDKNFCILKYAYPRIARLNMPLIMVLNDGHKIEPMVFYKSFQENVHDIAYASNSNLSAWKFLRRLGQTFIAWDPIYLSGISIIEEPFLKSILNYLMKLRLNEDFKSKMRLSLPVDAARCAFGIVDDTGILKPGQIFFQATEMDEDKNVYPGRTFIPKGQATVFRNPIMQPGDMRCLEAVDVPELRHLKDCIVFPVKGGRSHADEMSGGDYDGDEFVIIWDGDFRIKKNFKPMDFPYGQSSLTKNDITQEDMSHFFCEYFKKQNIGKIATDHIKVADYHPMGLQSKECQKLAYNYNIMLDSGKTGFFRTDYYQNFLTHEPDFKVFSSTKNQYLSQKILGELHRQCNLLDEIMRIANSSFSINLLKTHSNANGTILTNRFSLKNWDFFKTEAKAAFQSYKLRIQNLLEKAEVHDEAVLFVDYYQIETPFSYSMKELKNYFFELFQKQSDTLKLDKYGQLLLISAWYSICLQHPCTYKNKPLMGLPWLVADEMVKLAKFIAEHPEAEIRVLKNENETNFEMVENLVNDILEKRTDISSNATPYIFKDWQVNEETLIEGRWNPEFGNIFPKVHDLKFRFLVNMKTATLHIASDCIMDIFGLIQTEIYLYNKNIKIVGDQRKYSELELLRNIVYDLLQELLDQYLMRGYISFENTNGLPTVSSLLNIFFLYLHNLAFNVNVLLSDKQRTKDPVKFMNDVFLLKYSIFALTFINKVNINHDIKFTDNVRNMVLNNLDHSIYCLTVECSENIRNFVNNIKNVPHDYRTVLRTFFYSELRSNPVSMRQKRDSYTLLPIKREIKLGVLRHKLIFLTGCKDVSLKVSDTYYPELPNEGPNFRTRSQTNKTHQRSESPEKMIDVEATGHSVNLALLRAISGHPNLVDILENFGVFK